MKNISEKFEYFINKIGGLTSYLILAILAFVTYEVVARYVFNAPTNWVWLISKQVFGVYVVVAGSYALIHKHHIRIEMFYDRFTPGFKTLIRWFTLFNAMCFLGVLLWKSGAMGLDAWEFKEKSIGVLRLPLYPLKMFIPVGVALFIASCLVFFTRKEKTEKKGIE
jgi:TRAP-type mannitol/chloroaromatic compound transport system permease small subunit